MCRVEGHFLVRGFTAFCVSFVQGKTADCHVEGRDAREVEMAGNSFGSSSVISFIIATSRSGIRAQTN